MQFNWEKSQNYQEMQIWFTFMVCGILFSLDRIENCSLVHGLCNYVCVQNHFVPQIIFVSHYNVMFQHRDWGQYSPHSSVSTLKEISRIPGNPDRFRVIFGK